MRYYTYIYLDPRYSGRYTYGNLITFFYKPRYVGKGEGFRCFVHLKYKIKKGDNKQFYGYLENIRKLNYNLKEYIIKVLDNVTDEVAKEYEITLIKTIGRKDLRIGSLFNHTDGGTGGNTLSNHPNKDKILGKLHDKRRGSSHNWGDKISKSRMGHTVSKELIDKMRKSKTGKIAIYNNKIKQGKFIEVEYLDQYLQNGWNRGRVPIIKKKNG